MTNQPKQILYDNSRLEDFRKCPRKFYFRHVRDWETTGFNAALSFGLAWHDCQDVIWPAFCKDGKYNKIDVRDETSSELTPIVGAAVKAFEKTWTDAGGPSYKDFLDMSSDMLKQWQPRNMITASEMIWNYILIRASYMQQCKLIEVEQPFAVPLDPGNPDLFYVGRLDKVVEHKGRIYAIEHKTTTLYAKSGYFRKQFLDSFSPNSQIDGYLHAIHMLYGKKAKGVMVDAALVHKDVHEGFRFIPVERKLAQLDAWLWSVHEFIAQVERDKGLLNNRRNNFPKSKYLAAFPQKTEACNLYNRACEYMDLCKSWANPDNEDTPDGFRENHWDPVVVLQLKKLGLGEG